MLWQAHEIEAVANITIQAILSGNASREAAASGLRKRKIGDMFVQPGKRHNSILSEGELYQSFSGGPQQVCCTRCPSTRLMSLHSSFSCGRHPARQPAGPLMHEGSIASVGMQAGLSRHPPTCTRQQRALQLFFLDACWAALCMHLGLACLHRGC